MPTSASKIVQLLLHDSSLLKKNLNFNYLQLIKFYGYRSQFTQMNEILELMDEKYRRDIRMYTTLYSIYARTHQQDKIYELICEMETQNIVYDVSFFNCLISNNDDERFIVLALDKMKAMSIQPDEVTYETLIRMYTRQNNEDAVLKLLTQMETINLTPNEETYCTLISWMGTYERIDKAMEFYQEMLRKEIRPNMRIYKEFVRILIETGQVQHISILLMDMKRFGLKPTAKLKSMLKRLDNLYPTTFQDMNKVNKP